MKVEYYNDEHSYAYGWHKAWATIVAGMLAGYLSSLYRSVDSHTLKVQSVYLTMLRRLQ